MTAVLQDLLADLAAEGAALAAELSTLTLGEWALPTPASGWTIAHQVAHLAWTDELSLLAVTDPEGFAASATSRDAAALAADVDSGAETGAGDAPDVLLARWELGWMQLAEAIAALPAGARVPWFGPPMSAASMATARVMETWAHGVDISDALGRPPRESRVLAHIAHLGVRTRDFAFAAHGIPPPTQPIRVELAASDGSAWTAGPPDASQRITGPLLDFCLRVVQRRRPAELSLVATGSDAETWLDVAQAFAGPPGAGGGERRTAPRETDDHIVGDGRP